MELEVLDVRGAPKNGVISVSAGGMRKQVQISAIDRPIRFPGKAEDISQVKVDLLTPLGRARVPYNANGQRFTLPLDGANGEPIGNMEVDVVMRPADPLSSSLTQEQDAEARRRKEEGANSYLEEHDLVGFMQFLLHSLMQDKPADPYPFLQKQVAMRMSAKAGGVPPIRMDNVPPPIITEYPATTTPLAPPPVLEDSEDEVTGLLESLSPQAAAVSLSTPEGIAHLEAKALEAKKRLMEDNEKLRDLALQMNSEYENLMKESQALHQKLDAKRKVKERETRTQEAYKEIEKLQDEVAQLARENAKLVADLARGREMIDLVRQDMLEIRRSVGE